MLRRLQVDGYRSLVAFDIELEPGLNILVGANGTGKTNFISFLDFLGELVENDLNSAIAVAQGAGAVFSKEKFSSNSARLRFIISGDFDTSTIPLDLIFLTRNKESIAGSYRYSACIAYLRDIPAVVIEEEKIDLEFTDGGPVHLHRTTSRTGNSFTTNVLIEAPPKSIFDEFMIWDEKYVLSR